MTSPELIRCMGAICFRRAMSAGGQRCEFKERENRMSD